MKYFTPSFLTIVLGASLLASGAAADAASAGRVAPVIARILSYERTLPARAGGTVDILVLHAASSQAEARAFERAFGGMSGSTVQGLPLRISVRPYAPGALEAAAINGVDVVLVCSGLDAELDAISNATRRRHLLTVGVTREHATRGTALAVIIEEGRPKIIANLAHARAEGVQLSSQLLRLSEVL